jgi:hypothetical protein
VVEIKEERDLDGQYKGYGKYITLRHVNSIGKVVAGTRYGHLNEFKVTLNQKVREGEVIGLSGNTGTSTAHHLHFEYAPNAIINRSSKRIDPTSFVNSTSVRLIGATAKLKGTNDCSFNTRSSWEVKFDYTDRFNKINPATILTFQVVEPITGPPFTINAGTLKTTNGLVNSPFFCALFGEHDFFKVKVSMNTKGEESNCVYFLLKKPLGALTVVPTDELLGIYNDQAELMNRVIGSYKIYGMYNGKTIENTIINVTIKSAAELEVFGLAFPSFRIENFSIAYSNLQDMNDYIIGTEAVKPNSGGVHFSFPSKEILIGVSIKINETTTRDLIVAGVKQ